MACLSPSPSGRRLSELLEEKQEPFFLDLHLLEKGCSSRLLDGYDTAVMCWPAAGKNDAASVLRRLTSSSKKKKSAASKKKQAAPAGTGLLRMLLSKILHGKTAAAKKPAALQCSESFKVVVASSSPCSKHLDAVKTVVADEETGYSYSDSDSDDGEKQLSPVSVLEHPFDSSPVHHGNIKCSGSPKNAMAFVLRELLEAAYTPALLTQLLANSDDLIKGTTTDFDDDDYYCRTSPKNVDEATSAAAYWEANRVELARVSELVASEVPCSRLDAASAVQPERRDVGADVEAAVLEQLLLELVVDLASC